MTTVSHISAPVTANDQLAVVYELVKQNPEGIGRENLAKRAERHHINTFELGIAVAALKGSGRLKILHGGCVRVV